jgi:hypothetical protein
MQVEEMHVLLPVEDIVEVAGPMHQVAAAAAMQDVMIREETDLAVVGDVDVVAVHGPEDVVEDFDARGGGTQADVRAGFRMEAVVDHLHVGDAGRVHPGGHVAAELVVHDHLAGFGEDRDLVRDEAVELDRAGEVRAGRIALDAVGERHVGIGPEDPAAGDAGGVVGDHLALHAAGEVDAGGVVVDAVGRGGEVEAEAAAGVVDAGDDAGDIAKDVVVAQFGGGRVIHTNRRAVDRVATDRPAEGGGEIEPGAGRGDVVGFDDAGGRAADADRGRRAGQPVAQQPNLDSVVHHDAGRPAQDAVALQDGCVSRRR